MRVILREDVPELGIIGEIVNVRPGYARNYLLPRGLAVVADERNVHQLEHEKRVIEAKRLRERGSVEALAEALSGQRLEVEMRAGRGGRLFGSVSSHDVKRLLEGKGFDIDRRRIDLKTPIKEVGEHEVLIRVGQDVTTAIQVAVVPQGGELVDEAVEGGAGSEGVKSGDAVTSGEVVASAEDATSEEPEEREAAGDTPGTD